MLAINELLSRAIRGNIPESDRRVQETDGTSRVLIDAGIMTRMERKEGRAFQGSLATYSRPVDSLSLGSRGPILIERVHGPDGAERQWRVLARI